MAGTPRFKIYNAQGEYVAACKHLEDAAAIMACNNVGATIRDGHTKADVIYTHDGNSDSYDAIANAADEALVALQVTRAAKWEERKRESNERWQRECAGRKTVYMDRSK